MTKAPPFWFEPRGAWSSLLRPASALFGAVAARRMSGAPEAEVPAPVLCVGNFVAGGAGKTPVALALARIARAEGRRPGFLSRGHGGTVRGPTRVDPGRHTAREVGDEPLLLAAEAPAVVSADRPAGARLLVEAGCDLVVMDDGFQNPSLRKDVSVVVVDGGRGIGNGLVMPAGPLRAPLAAQLRLTDALVVVGRRGAGGGEHASVSPLVRAAARRGAPILRAALHATERLDGVRALAFAGIGDPAKFFATVEEAGAQVVERAAFGDHQPYADEAILALLERADASDLVPVTTSKDAARLRGGGAAARRLLERARVLSVELRFEDARRARRLVERAAERAARRR